MKPKVCLIHTLQGARGSKPTLTVFIPDCKVGALCKACTNVGGGTVPRERLVQALELGLSWERLRATHTGKKHTLRLEKNVHEVYTEIK